MTEPTRPQVFVSYSHHDDAWRQRLFDDFVATTFGDMLVWSDAWLRAGDAWASEIDQRLQSCSVAVLLASPHFLASRFIGERELPRILERARGGALRIVWIPIALTRAHLEAELPALAALQAAAALDDALPADAQGCSAEQVQRVREQVHRQLQRAVDPVGAELAAQLAPRYAVGARIAAGNRAAVYRAHDRVLDRDVAIKVPSDREQTQREAFMDDVRRAVRLSAEPNFIDLYDCGPPEALAYCVERLVEGHTLRERIDAQPPAQPLPVALLRRIFGKLVHAIVRAHAQGVTYGNLKPGNIILDAEDEPFILPVGRRAEELRNDRRLAALLAHLAEARHHQAPPSAADADDLAYLVPDAFGDQVQPIDPAQVDQYMLGLLGWEMATGQRPATVREPRRLLELGRSAFGELPPLRQLRPLAPQRLEALLARMAARRARDRFPDLRAALRELDAMPDMGLMIVLDSWRRVATDDSSEHHFFERFYAAFLQSAPAARPYFAHFGAEDWPRQYRLLKEAVLLLLAFHEQGGDAAEPNVLSRIAASHRTIPAVLYAPFLDALVQTLCGDTAEGIEPADPLCRSPRDRDVLEEHWRAALEPGIRWLAERGAR